MSEADTPEERKQPSPPLTSRDWAIVDHALEDVHQKEMLTVPTDPPALFGAGGPM